MSGDRRRRLVSDVDRTRGLMTAVIADARRVGAEVPLGVTASIELWRTWADRLLDWVERHRDGDPDDAGEVGRPG
jgi:hypothetical protein